MPGRVVDASVVAAMAFEEPNAREAASLVEGYDLSAPTVLHYELASVALKKARRYPSQRDAIAGGVRIDTDSDDGIGGTINLEVDRLIVENIDGGGVFANRLRDVEALRFGTVRDHITIYDFRHLWISDALMMGVDVMTVARMAGTSVAMIEKVYGHFRNDHLQEAQAKIDAGRKELNGESCDHFPK